MTGPMTFGKDCTSYIEDAKKFYIQGRGIARARESLIEKVMKGQMNTPKI